MKDYKTLKIEEREEGISIITLSRPQRLNAISLEMVEEFLDYLNILEHNLDIHVVVLTGEGGAFCAGIDLKDMGAVKLEQLPEEYHRYKYLQVKDPIKKTFMIQKLVSKIMIKLRKIPQPLIAAVKGPAFGGGFMFSMGCDIRIIGQSTIFCNAVIKIGMSGADCGNTYWLPRLIGFSKAAEIIYTGRNVDAQEAEKIGLVSKVVPDSDVLEEALKIAREMLKKSLIGIRLTKEALNLNIDAPSLESAIELENRNQIICSQTNDAEEGIFSFLEKREPKYDKW